MAPTLYTDHGGPLSKTPYLFLGIFWFGVPGEYPGEDFWGLNSTTSGSSRDSFGTLFVRLSSRGACPWSWSDTSTWPPSSGCLSKVRMHAGPGFCYPDAGYPAADEKRIFRMGPVFTVNFANHIIRENNCICWNHHCGLMSNNKK